MLVKLILCSSLSNPFILIVKRNFKLILLVFSSCKPGHFIFIRFTTSYLNESWASRGDATFSLSLKTRKPSFCWAFMFLSPISKIPFSLKSWRKVDSTTYSGMPKIRRAFPAKINFACSTDTPTLFILSITASL